MRSKQTGKKTREWREREAESERGKNPPLILLDEATSSLDAETEKRLQGALDGLSKQRSVLVIAHRLGTIRNADRICVLSGGEIVERGTHDELLQKEGGKYKQLWEIQLHSATDGGGGGGGEIRAIKTA
jgi:ABC-type transport system involved in cytochrome bd biosynthesis fused ATPase/permease subunit